MVVADICRGVFQLGRLGSLASRGATATTSELRMRDLFIRREYGSSCWAQYVQWTRTCQCTCSSMHSCDRWVRAWRRFARTDCHYSFSARRSCKNLQPLCPCMPFPGPARQHLPKDACIELESNSWTSGLSGYAARLLGIALSAACAWVNMRTCEVTFRNSDHSQFFCVVATCREWYRLPVAWN